jgi:hypothetical protein
MSHRRKSFEWCDDCGRPHPLWMLSDGRQGRTKAERLGIWRVAS